MTIEYEQALWIEFGDRMSRPKDQDRDEPATPPAVRTSSLGWTGTHFTVGELRSWLDRIPNNATIEILLDPMNKHELEIRTTIQATWEIL